MGKIRLDKFLADMGLGTRSEVKKEIHKGQVRVNGIPERSPEYKLDIQKDLVEVNGRQISYAQQEYYMLNKPAGVVSATEDKKDMTVLDLIQEKQRKDLFPVGRLDKDSSGLIIMTNDGNLAYELTHPSIKVAKTYIVKVDGKLNDEQLKKLSDGIEIEKGKIAYCDWTILEQTKQYTLFEIILYQGLNRQIRKMFEFLGYNVINLKRIRHANIELTGLKKGQIKQIKPRQIKELKAYLNKIKDKEIKNAGY